MSLPNELVSVFWDYENCRYTSNVSGPRLVEKLRSVTERYGSIRSFKAYADLSLEFLNPKSANLHSELQSSGVSLIHCPHNGGKDVADKMMLVDLLAFAIDNPAPATIVLITGDRDFAYAASTLKLRGYKLILIAPSVCAHSSLKAQASVLLDWQKDILGLSAPSPSRASMAMTSTSNQFGYEHRSRAASLSGEHVSANSVASVFPGSKHEVKLSSESSRITQPEILPSPGVSTAEAKEGEFEEWSRQVPHIRRALASGLPPRCHSVSSVRLGRVRDVAVGSAANEQLDMCGRADDTRGTETCSADSPSCKFEYGRRVNGGEERSGLHVGIQSVKSSDSQSSCSQDHQRGAEASLTSVAVEAGFSSLGKGPLPSSNIPADVYFDDTKANENEHALNDASTPSSTPALSSAPNSSIPSDMSIFSSSTSLYEDSSYHVPFDPRFALLVQVMRRRKEKFMQTKIRSSKIARELKNLDPQAYEKAGVTRLKCYLQEARRAGILKTGELNAEGDSWVELQPHLYDSSQKVVHSWIFRPLLAILGPGDQAEGRILISRLASMLKERYPAMFELVRAKGLIWHAKKAAEEGVIRLGNIDCPEQMWAELAR